MAAPPPTPPPPPSPPAPSPSPSPSPSLPPPPESSQATPAVAVKSEVPPSSAKEIPSNAPSTSGEPSPSVSAAIAVPSHARWFSFGEIHETERRILPEFFDGSSAAKNPSVYKYYRDSIIRRFRENPARKVTFTEVRRSLVGDVGSIRRVFDFLETWGLINYTSSEKPGAKGGAEDREKRVAEEGSEKREGAAKKFCTTCKSECNIVSFVTEKVTDLVLCARCFVKGSFRGGLTHADFRRLDVGGNTEEKKRDWTDKDILHLLEALLQYGDDWKKVAGYVGGGKSEKDCVTRFIRLPFAEQFMAPLGNKTGAHCYLEDDLGDTKAGGGDVARDSSPSKRMRLSPLADASNPIMSQVAFLSAVAGSKIAEAAAHAAIAALDDVNLEHQEDICDTEPITDEADGEGATPSKDHTFAKGHRDAAAEARAQLEKEQQDMEESLSHIVGVQMKEIQEKIVHFEELELLMEKEWLQLQHMKNLLFADQLNLLQQRSKLKPPDSENLEPPDSGNTESIKAANDAAC
ncbi:hypothetical protein Taro_002303 [Colocasia esculenta]|uniref:SWI/SNF complex subunit SWI3B n=1 Tax=Colocasia esculenta TaxID=4460 RepID=A0A843TG38_COLES|nr:hypothetical protein [Colocasia esculenta]